MEIKRAGSQSSTSSSAKAAARQEGPPDWFTGKIWIDPLFEAPEPARVRGASVTFEPRARTALPSSYRSAANVPLIKIPEISSATF
jgi:quercetin dioxygenase-like cupin family protein